MYRTIGVSITKERFKELCAKIDGGGFVLLTYREWFIIERDGIVPRVTKINKKTWDALREVFEFERKNGHKSTIMYSLGRKENENGTK